MIESNDTQIVDVIVSYPDYAMWYHNGVPHRTEAISQTQVLDWAHDNAVPMDLVNPHGATHAIYVLAPVTPEQTMLVKLRWC
jgi:hypothetical protein